MIVELDENNFEEQIKSGLKLVEFYTEWCGYCKRQRPVLEDLSENNIWIGTINADKNQKTTENYNITGFPSFLLFKEGKIISRISGYHNKSELLSKIVKMI